MCWSRPIIVQCVHDLKRGWWAVNWVLNAIKTKADLRVAFECSHEVSSVGVTLIFVLASKVGNPLASWGLVMCSPLLSCCQPVNCLPDSERTSEQWGWRGERLLSVPGLGDQTAERWLKSISAVTLHASLSSCCKIKVSKAAWFGFSPWSCSRIWELD